MIIKVSKAAGFKDLAHYLEHGKGQNYVEDPNERVAWAETRNLFETERPAIVREMRATAAESDRVQYPVTHFIISWKSEKDYSPGADEPTRAEMRYTADQVLERLGLKEHQVWIVAHKDTDAHHLHMMVNRVHPYKHRAWDMWKSVQRGAQVLHDIEREKGWAVPRKEHELIQKGYVTRGRRGRRLAMTAHEAPEHQHLWERKRKEPSIRQRAAAVLESTPVREASSWRDVDLALDRDGLHIKPEKSGYVVGDGKTYAALSSVTNEVSAREWEQRFGRAHEDGNPPRDMSQSLNHIRAERTPEEWNQRSRVEGEKVFGVPPLSKRGKQLRQIEKEISQKNAAGELAQRGQSVYEEYYGRPPLQSKSLQSEQQPRLTREQMRQMTPQEQLQVPKNRLPIARDLTVGKGHEKTPQKVVGAKVLPENAKSLDASSRVRRGSGRQGVFIAGHAARLMTSESEDPREKIREAAYLGMSVARLMSRDGYGFTSQQRRAHAQRFTNDVENYREAKGLREEIKTLQKSGTPMEQVRATIARLQGHGSPGVHTKKLAGRVHSFEAHYGGGAYKHVMKVAPKGIQKDAAVMLTKGNVALSMAKQFAPQTREKSRGLSL